MNQNLLELSARALPTGHLLQYDRDPLGFWMMCAKKYGDIVMLDFGGMPVCFISNTQLIEEVLWDRTSFIKGNVAEMLEDLFGKGLFTSDGEPWKLQRQSMQALFLQKRIASYAEIMVDRTNKMLENWSDGGTLDIRSEMRKLMINIAMKTIFNQDFTDKEAQIITDSFEQAMDWYDLKRSQGYDYDRDNLKEEDIQYKKAMSRLNRLIYKIIETKRKNRETSKDLFSILIELKDKKGNSLSDRQLRDQAVTLLFAVHETAVNTISWTWMLLSQHPAVRLKLQEELKEVLDNNKPSASDYNRLPYSQMVIKESMRLYPGGTELYRQTTREYNLGGYKIPADCTVMMSQWVSHRNANYFHEPEKFKPARWTNNLEKQLPRGVYYPFGSGERSCIGKGFASMQILLLLATISQKYELDLLPNQTINPRPSISLGPKKGIKVVLKKL